MTINEYLQQNKKIEISAGYSFRRISPRLICNDGFNMSVQVSDSHYCSPRVIDAYHYESVEIGMPSEEEILLAPFSDGNDLDNRIYPFVPIEIVEDVIEKHGGIKCP